MTELQGEHATEQLRWNEYIKARIAAGLASAALKVADWSGDRWEYQEEDGDE